MSQPPTAEQANARRAAAEARRRADPGTPTAYTDPTTYGRMELHLAHLARHAGLAVGLEGPAAAFGKRSDAARLVLEVGGGATDNRLRLRLHALAGSRARGATLVAYTGYPGNFRRRWRLDLEAGLPPQIWEHVLAAAVGVALDDHLANTQQQQQSTDQEEPT